MKRLTAKEEEIMGFFWTKGPLFVKRKRLSLARSIRKYISLFRHSNRRQLPYPDVEECYQQVL